MSSFFYLFCGLSDKSVIFYLFHVGNNNNSRVFPFVGPLYRGCPFDSGGAIVFWDTTATLHKIYECGGVNAG